MLRKHDEGRCVGQAKTPVECTVYGEDQVLDPTGRGPVVKSEAVWQTFPVFCI